MKNVMFALLALFGLFGIVSASTGEWIGLPQYNNPGFGISADPSTPANCLHATSYQSGIPTVFDSTKDCQYNFYFNGSTDGPRYEDLAVFYSPDYGSTWSLLSNAGGVCSTTALVNGESSAAGRYSCNLATIPVTYSGSPGSYLWSYPISFVIHRNSDCGVLSATPDSTCSDYKEMIVNVYQS